PAFAAAIARLVLTRVVPPCVVLRGVFGAAVVALYRGLWLSGITMAGGRTEGVLMTPLETGGSAWWPSLEVSWPVLVAEWRNFLAMLVVVVVTILLNAAGLELATQREVDLDRELRASGLASLVSGVGGGMVGYLSVSRSLL